MLVCTLDGDLYPPLEEPTGTDPKSKKKDKDKDKKFIWNHGITCPLKNTRKRRFRKTAKKKYIESPDVEKEVKRLLSTDADAVSVRILLDTLQIFSASIGKLGILCITKQNILCVRDVFEE
ncbi:transcription initiation factor TFIID subunit 7 [Ilyodon furcidens]|uniref:Transcription initiation factor TFIID subunit 7 n=1 Tax=Ilyodon furcidens TaxID=33524 RepID=A0ABV0UJ36_9TELE